MAEKKSNTLYVKKNNGNAFSNGLLGNAQQRGMTAWDQRMADLGQNGAGNLQTGETAGNGALGWLKDSFDAGFASSLGGTARLAGEFSPVGNDMLNSFADRMDQIAVNNSPQAGQELNGLDYVSSAIGNALGSGAATMLEAGALAAGAKALGAGALASSVFGAAKAKPIIGTVAKGAEALWKSPYGKYLVANVAGSPLEAAAEAGNLITDMRREQAEKGYTDDDIRAAALRSAALNTAWLTGANMAEAGILGKVAGALGKGITKKGAKNIAKQALLGAGTGAISEGGEEYVQNLIGDYSKRAELGDLNYDEALEAAKMGAIGGGFLGGVGSGISGYLNRNALLTGTNDEAKAKFNDSDYDSLEGSIKAEGKKSNMDDYANMQTISFTNPEDNTPESIYSAYLNGVITKDAAQALMAKANTNTIVQKQTLTPDQYLAEKNGFTSEQLGETKLNNKGVDNKYIDAFAGAVDIARRKDIGQKAAEQVRNTDMRKGVMPPISLAGETPSDPLSTAFYGALKPDGNVLTSKGFVAGYGKANNGLNTKERNKQAKGNKTNQAIQFAQDAAGLNQTNMPIGASRSVRDMANATQLALASRQTGAKLQPGFEAPQQAADDVNSTVDRLMVEQAVNNAFDSQKPFMPPEAYSVDRKEEAQKLTDIINAIAAKEWDKAEMQPELQKVWNQPFVPQRQSVYNGALRRNLATLDNVQPDELPTVNRGTDEWNIKAANAQVLREQTLPTKREQAKNKQFDVPRLLGPNMPAKKRTPSNPLVRGAIDRAREGREQRARDKRYKEIKQDIIDYISTYPNTEDQLKALKEARQTNIDGLHELLQPTYDKLVDGMGNGVVDEYKNRETGLVEDLSGLKKGAEERKNNSTGYERQRFSLNAKWYSEWIREYNRRPNKAELYDLAETYYLGKEEIKDAAASWYDGTQEAEDLRKQREAEVAEYHDYIDACNVIAGEIKLGKNYYNPNAGNNKKGETTIIKEPATEQKPVTEQAPTIEQKPVTEQKPTVDVANDNINLPDGITVTVSYNKDKNGVELKFSHSPGKEVTSQLTQAGFRWLKKDKKWYSKRDNPKAMAVVKQLEEKAGKQDENQGQQNQNAQGQIPQKAEAEQSQIGKGQKVNTITAADVEAAMNGQQEGNTTTVTKPFDTKDVVKNALEGFEQYLIKNINDEKAYNDWTRMLHVAVKLSQGQYIPEYVAENYKGIEVTDNELNRIIDDFVYSDRFTNICRKVFDDAKKNKQRRIVEFADKVLKGVEKYLEKNLNETAINAAKEGNWADFLNAANRQIINDYLPKQTEGLSQDEAQKVNNSILGTTKLKNAIEKVFRGIIQKNNEAKATSKKPDAGTFAKNPDSIFNDGVVKNLPKPAKDIVNQMPAGQDNTNKTNNKQGNDNKKGSKYDYGDKNQAVNDLLGTLGLKKKKDKVSDVEGIDYSDDGLDEAFKDLNKELSKMSANPMFNPALYRAAAKVGLILLKRAGKTFAKWAKMMLDTFKKSNPENEEKIKPYLGAIYKNIENWPSDLEFKDDTVEAACRVVGGYYSEGLTTFDEIYKALSDNAGEEIAGQLKGYLQQAFYAIDELENPTLSLEGNVVKSNIDNTNSEGGKENDGLSGNGGEMAGNGPASGAAEGNPERNGERQGVQNWPSGQTNEIPQGERPIGAGGAGGLSEPVGGPAPVNGGNKEEREDTNDVGGESPVSGKPQEGRSGTEQESGPDGENGNDGASGELLAPVSRRRINKGKYSILSNGNYHANSEDALLGDGKHQPEERFSINLKAVEALMRLQEEGIEPTPEELDAMAHYTGWGGMRKLLFDGTWESPKYHYDKFWREANDKLREVLGKEKWEVAWLNADNQFYTPPNVISKMWKLAEQLGFKGGRVLEPSMGVGNFYALMPEKLQKNSVLTGVEIDPIAGELAKALYPDGHIFVQGYEKHAAPENFYDFIIGNVPFGEAKLSDARFTAGFTGDLQIHDFFLVKNIGQLQPGGILMAITTHNTLDKANPTVRLHLAREAELVGALRLPNGAFNGTGTDVLTDILIFKKRDQRISMNEAAALPWVKTKNHSVVFRGESNVVRYNAYFDANKNKVLGTIQTQSNKYGGLDMSVAPRNFEEDYANAISELPKNIMKKTKTKTENEYTAANQKIKDRGLYYNKKGELVYRDGTIEKQVTLEDYRYSTRDTDKVLQERKQKVDSLMKLHDKYAKLIEAERNKADNLEDIRKTALNAFEEHTKKYGYYVKYKKGKDGGTKVSFAREILFFRNIGDSEKFIDISSLDYNNTPAPILLKKVTTDYNMGERTISNAYLKQLFNGRTTLDIDELAKDSDTTKEKVIEELIKQNAAFKAPNGEYQPTNIYLSGNIVIKLREAETAYEMGDKDMKRNIEALKAVRPKLIPYVSITAQIGSSWIDSADYEQFIAELLRYKSPIDIGVKVTNKAGAWNVTIDSKYALENPYATEKYGLKAPFVNFTDFIEAAMNKKKLMIKKPKTEHGKIIGYEDDPEATKLAEQRVEAINRAFHTWVWSGERRTRMELAYNDKMNAVVPPTFDASLMQFDGLIKELNGKPFDPRIHQRNFVLRALLNGRGGAYHEAGTGKTLIMSMLCMELRKSGKSNKPLILAHNANAAQVARDIKTFYPTSKVLYIPSFSGTADKINATKRMIGQIRSGDWDAVVIPHEAVKKIAFSEETLMAIKSEELEAIKDNIRNIAIEEAEESGGRSDFDVSDNDLDLTEEDIAAAKGKNKKRGKPSKNFGERTKRAIAQYKRILLEIKKQAENFEKDDYIAFENMDIDSILVDECHVFKKTPKVTKRNVKGVDASTSGFGIKLSCIADYINMKQGNKGVYLFSGTMITNTIPEIHSMMRLVMPDTLKQANIYNLDDFLNVFTGTDKDTEPTADGTWEPVERLRKFYNITELKRLAGQDFDIVNVKNLPGFELRALPNGKTLESKDLTEAERDELLNGRTENPKGLPNFKIQNVIVPKTKRMKAIEEAVQKYALKYKRAEGSEKMRLQIAGWGTKLQTLPAAIGVSIRNLDPALRDTPKSKVNLCVRNVVEIYHSHDKACQVIFAEKGFSGISNRTHKIVDTVPTPKGPKAKATQTLRFKLNGYNMVEDLVQKLVNEGIPRNEIAVVDKDVKDDARADVAERVSAGEIRVVIGSSKTLGVGVNMQKNLRAAHHLDAVWMPGDLDQMNKRSKRQGNCWNTVLCYRYITPGFDGKIWSALAQKQAFITSFIDKDNNVRVIDGDALSIDGEGENGEGGMSVNDIVETLTNAVDDVRVLQKEKYKNKLEQYSENEIAFQKNKDDAMKEANNLLQSTIPNIEKKIKDYKEDYAFYKKNKPEKFVCKIKTPEGWKEFTDKTKAEGVLKTILKNAKSNEKYCEFAGFRVTLESQSILASGGYTLTAHSTNGQEYYTASGTFNGLMQVLASIPKRQAKAEETLKMHKETLKIKEQEAKEKSPYRDIVDNLQNKLNALEKDIQENPVPAPEWFRLKVPTDTYVEYKGKQYLVTGYAVKHLDQPYRVIATYTDDNGLEKEMYIPANKALVDGFPVLSDEEMNIDPKEEIFDESDDTPELDKEIKQAVDAVDKAFASTAEYDNPRKAELEVDDKTFDVTVRYQTKPPAAISDAYPIGKKVYVTDDNSEKNKKVEIYGYEKDVFGNNWQISTVDEKGVKAGRNPYSLSDKVDGEPIMSYDQYLRAVGRVKKGEYDYDHGAKAETKQQKAAAQAVLDMLKGANIEVITDLDEVKRVYDSVTNGNAKIEQNLEVKALTTPNGELHGFAYRGKIYIDPNLLNANTPIHEYTHLWDLVLQKRNPALWKHGKELMKRLPLWEEIKQHPAYAERAARDEDFLATEVHARLTGYRGEELLIKMAENEEVSTGIIDKLKKWLQGFWYFMRDVFSKWSNEDIAKVSLKDFANMPLADLVKGTNISEMLDNDTRFEFNARIENKSAKGKIASAFTNTERKTTIQSTKDFLKEHWKNFYSDFVDKNNVLHAFDALTKSKGGLSLYEQVQNLPSTTAGMLSAITEGTAKHIEAANQHLKNVKMKHKATLSMALNTINKATMDKAHPGYLRQNGFDSWVNAFGAYLGAERLLEMSDIAKAENETYKFPNGLTEKELRDFVQAAPVQFKKAADIFYKVNDNVISIMEDSQVFSHELAQALRTKYKKYCPLLRDFSDTAAADTFLEGLSNGGRGIGNVSIPLKKISISGSERGVLNPLETVLKSYATMLNRAERNRVGLMAVKNAEQYGLDNLIQEVPEVKGKDGKVVNAVADPKNCIFTVLVNGQKKAYKTTQDLYGPIVGYNLPAASLVFGVARTAAKMLRTGATMSPSFIVRNIIRDTVFAGVASRNGFIPILDTWRGAQALMNNPTRRAEFEAAGVTEFNFYGSKEQRIKSIDAMAGEKPVGIVEMIKWAFQHLEDVSAFAESATRMGEFMKARDKGLTMEEAARAAREVTLDFSRSGRVGEQINQVVPFFNACIQGGDKMVRLLKEDPLGTLTKLTKYIILPSLFLWAINHDDDWYKELDPDIKNNYWCLTKDIRVPKPQEAGVLFGSGIEALFEQASANDPKAMKNWAKAFLSNMIPGVVPTLFLPILEWQANYSYFKGRQLVGNKYKNMPDELQYSDYTSELSKSIGNNPLVKLSPMKIDNLVRGYTGTMGYLLWSTPDSISNKAKDLPAKHWYEYYPIRDFAVTDSNLSRSTNDFYELLDKANKQHNGYGKKGSPNATVQAIRHAGTNINNIRKDIDRITKSKAMSPERKRQLIDIRKKKINEIAKRTVLKYRDKV